MLSWVSSDCSVVVSQRLTLTSLPSYKHSSAISPVSVLVVVVVLSVLVIAGDAAVVRLPPIHTLLPTSVYWSWSCPALVALTLKLGRHRPTGCAPRLCQAVDSQHSLIRNQGQHQSNEQRGSALSTVQSPVQLSMSDLDSPVDRVLWLSATRNQLGSGRDDEIWIRDSLFSGVSTLPTTENSNQKVGLFLYLSYCFYCFITLNSRQCLLMTPLRVQFLGLDNLYVELSTHVNLIIL